ncbi:MAG: 3-deoxy-D-manno-octulosonic acid transferase [Betaproteobacteria bacterium]|nr:3-deoxy-D-manno-octulosonic acid transferase [Betaproteobacteria bacterium]
MIWRYGYTLVLWLMLPLVVTRLWWRGVRERSYRLAWGERFGFYTGVQSRAPEQTNIWVHAVSLGEVHAAKPLVEKLLASYPEARILFTQMTATGRDAALSTFAGRVQIAWLPYDYRSAARRFLDHFQPDIGIIIETEVWFNLIEACKAAGIPLFLANARLSEKSCLGYLRIAPLARRAFGAFEAIAAQTAADAARLSRLGARTQSVIGNLKFDATVVPGSDQLAQIFKMRFGGRPVFLAASTRDGEEEMLLDSLAGTALIHTLVVIVPRHPDRFDAVAELMKKRGLSFLRRSTDAGIPNDCQYVLGDSVGEMGAYYRASDVAFVAGSLLDFGGQNLIEACAAGVPVLIGPFTRNFEAVAEAAIEAGAALRVRDAAHLATMAAALLADPDLRAQMGEAGRAFCTAHQGATDKTLEIVARLLYAKRLTELQRAGK